MPGLRKFIKHRLYTVTFHRYWDINVYEVTAWGVDKVDSVTVREGTDEVKWDDMVFPVAASMKYARPDGNGVLDVLHDPVEHNIQPIPWGSKTAQDQYEKDMEVYRNMEVKDEKGVVVQRGVPFNMKVNSNLRGVDHTAGWFGGAAIRKFMRLLFILAIIAAILAAGLIYESNTRAVVCYEEYHGQIVPCLPVVTNSTSSSSFSNTGSSSIQTTLSVSIPGSNASGSTQTIGGG